MESANTPSFRTTAFARSSKRSKMPARAGPGRASISTRRSTGMTRRAVRFVLRPELGEDEGSATSHSPSRATAERRAVLRGVSHHLRRGQRAIRGRALERSSAVRGGPSHGRGIRGDRRGIAAQAASLRAAVCSLVDIAANPVGVDVYIPVPARARHLGKRLGELDAKLRQRVLETRSRVPKRYQGDGPALLHGVERR